VVITNSRNTPVTLDRISVDFRQHNSGWKKLKAVPTYGHELYWVYGIPAGLRDAGLLDFTSSGLDQVLMGKPIPAGTPVRGWIFFERPDGFNGAEGQPIQWRIKAKDSAGDEFEAVTEQMSIQRPFEPGSDLQPNAPALTFSAAHLDISQDVTVTP
jgi:hypothetical protein